MSKRVAIAGWGPVHGERHAFETGVRGGSELLARCWRVRRGVYAWAITYGAGRVVLCAQSRPTLRRVARKAAERELRRRVAAHRARRHGWECAA